MPAWNGSALTDVSITGIDDNATSTAITIDSSENVGIGTTSPAVPLDVNGSALISGRITVNSVGSGGGVSQGYQFGGDGNTGMYQDAYDQLQFSTNNHERMRIDSSGNLLVGKTTYAGGSGVTGIDIRPSGIINLAREGDTLMYMNRKNSDGTIVEFRKDGTNVGSISTGGGDMNFTAETGVLALGANGAQRFFVGSDNFYPAQDNTRDCGHGSFRFDDIYATNGTIQTSDRNEKQDIEELTEAEQRVAVACKGLMRKFRWIDKVAEKGDDARIHFGIIAQDLQDAFTAEGLDAGRYAMFISSTWWETQTEVPAVEAVEGVEATYDDEGNELTPAVEAVEAKDAYTRTDTENEPTEGYTERTRLGVRYPELLAFIISTI